MKIYFDNAATTAVREEVIEVMNKTMREDYGNPSSSHELGRRAATLLENSRKCIADALSAEANNIYFTSGGTESNNLAVHGCTYTFRHKKSHIITSASEHESIKAPIKILEAGGWAVTYLNPDSTGRIPVSDFSAALRDDTVFASIMSVNNETGAINPIAGYTQEIKRRNLKTIFHTDAVQGFCKIPFTVKSLGADLISVSAHKIHGPKGAGALYVSDKVKIAPLISGGGQEKDKRSGTQAMPAVTGFSEAVRLSRAELEAALKAAEDLHGHTVMLLNSEIPEAVVIAEGNSPYILCLSLPGYKSEVLLTYLSNEGIYVSKGSACKKGARSPTLEAMGLPAKIIDGALRVSFSRYNTREEAELFVRVLKKATETLVH